MMGYTNGLDLVMVSEADELCGFCVAWIRRQSSGKVVGQLEPLGVGEGHRGRGFSRALMGEAISRLRSEGASQIFVETDVQRTAAMSAYRAMGFKRFHELLVYRYRVSTS